MKTLNLFIFLILPLSLLGCETSTERMARYAEDSGNICQNQFGLKPGTEAYANCTINMVNLRLQQHQQNQRDSEILMNYGNYISRCGLSGQYCR